jgi:hypothetical protein
MRFRIMDSKSACASSLCANVGFIARDARNKYHTLLSRRRLVELIV